MKTDWLNKVQTRLRNEQHAQAPQGLLDDIKNEMRRRGMAPTCRPPRRRKVVALWGVRAASIAAFLAVGLYIVTRHTACSWLATNCRQRPTHNRRKQPLHNPAPTRRLRSHRVGFCPQCRRNQVAKPRHNASHLPTLRDGVSPRLMMD